MLNKHAKVASVVLLTLSSSAAMGQGFHKGFYAGLNSGASFVTGQTYSESTRGGSSSILVFRDEASARGYNGGALFGVNFYCDPVFIYGIELTGNLYSNRARQTWWNMRSVFEYSATQNYQDSWSLAYSADLTFKPGYFISPSTELYAIMGASVAGLKAELKHLTLGADNGDPAVRNHKTLYGAVLGAGIQRELCNRVSVFGSYQYSYYGKTNLSDAGDGGEGQISNRSLRIDANVFKLGVIYTF